MKAFLAILALLIGGVALFGFYVSDVPGTSAHGALPPSNEDERALATRLTAHIESLAHEIGERSASRGDALLRTRDYIEGQLRKTGVAFVEQEFGRGGVNVVVEIEGHGAGTEAIVIGAHYDTASRTPGADDNATGVAALLEIAARARPAGYSRTLHLVFFDRGAGRYAGTEDSGSRAWTRLARSKGEQVVAMLSLDALGCYLGETGTQSRPFPLAFFHPSRGNYVLFAGDFGSRQLMRSCAGMFRATASFPCEGAALPGWFPGLDASDHAAFRAEGWPAIVVTDTGSSRSSDVGQMSDTPDRLDYDSMSRVVNALVRVVEGLALRSTFAP